MKKTIQLSLIISAIALYSLKNVVGYSPLLVNILNDILALPFILICLEFIMKLIYGTKFEMTLDFVMTTFLVISILFEMIFPLFSKSITADPADIFWYFLGSVLFLTLKQFSENGKQKLNNLV
jgi:hypothetical protein